MILVKRVRRLVVAMAAVSALAGSLPAFSQDVSEAHLKAAYSAVAAIKATDLYDGILPGAAAGLKQSLIEKNPDMSDVITSTVDEKALALAARRADLEKEAALAYAKVFSEEDLSAIATFYTSPAGIKLLSDGPIVSRELNKAADIWQRGIARDLSEEVGKTLLAVMKAKAPLTAVPADKAPAAPAE